MNRILITGGAGFIASHAAEFYARKGVNATVCDNLSRTRILGKEAKTAMYNWSHPKKQANITLIRCQVRNAAQPSEAWRDDRPIDWQPAIDARRGIKELVNWVQDTEALL